MRPLITYPLTLTRSAGCVRFFDRGVCISKSVSHQNDVLELSRVRQKEDVPCREALYCLVPMHFLHPTNSIGLLDRNQTLVLHDRASENRILSTLAERSTPA